MQCNVPESCRDAAVRESLAHFVRAAGMDPAAIVDVAFFGNDAEQTDHLAQLVVSGRKVATTSLARGYGAGGERLPVPGDLILVVADGCRPRAIVRVTRVEIQPFCAVDAAFAREEGEGDRSLAYWRRVHREFFNAEAAHSGFSFREDDDVVLCRFSLVWPNVA